jgi:hypothetical protein
MDKAELVCGVADSGRKGWWDGDRKGWWDSAEKVVGCCFSREDSHEQPLSTTTGAGVGVGVTTHRNRTLMPE